MQLHIKILIASLIFAGFTVGFVYEKNIQPKYGAFTQLNSTDVLSNFPTTYNANLNKTIEVGTTSVDSITTLNNLTNFGVITSGTWHGSTITVPFGGTGSTTLSSGEVLLGNGTGNIITTTGWGTNGQSLVSNGAGIAPTWQTVSFNTSADYAVSGLWNFTGTSVRIKNLIASSTITINDGGAGLSYKLPTIRAASSTVLSEDGAGNLSWEPHSTIFISAAPNVSTGNLATTSMYTIVIPANTLTTSNNIRVTSQWDFTQIGVSCDTDLVIGNGSSTSTQPFSSGVATGRSVTDIMATTTTGEWAIGEFQSYGGTLDSGIKINPVTSLVSSFGFSPITSTMYLNLRAKVNTSGTCTLAGVTAQVFNQQ